MNAPQQFLGEASAGPRDTSVEQVAELEDSVLVRSLALYRNRLADDSPLRRAFESSI
jgi:hypothetical protein